MNGDCPRARGFANARDFRRVDARFIPARTDFGGHGQVRGVCNGGNDSADQLGFAHQRAALTVSGDLRRGTAKIQIDEFKTGTLQFRRCSRKNFGFASEKLQARDAFTGQSRQQFARRLIFAAGINPALCGEHFADRPCRARFVAQQPHRRVGYARHRRKPRARR